MKLHHRAKPILWRWWLRCLTVTCLLALGLVKVVAVQAAAADSVNNDGETASTTCKADPPEEWQCSLYLAPSSIPDAGFGIYTARDLAAGEALGTQEHDDDDDDDDDEEEDDEALPLQDLFVPIFDRYKTLPYRGQQHFLSWLSYIWPAAVDTFYHTYHDGSFPKIPQSLYGVDDGLNSADGLVFLDGEQGGQHNQQPVSAFAPGLASLVNSFPEIANIVKDWDTEQKDDATAETAPHTPHHGVTFTTLRDIPAGSELFLDYGATFHERLDEKYDTPAAFDTLDDLLEVLEDKEFLTEEEFRNDRENQGEVTVDLDQIDVETVSHERKLKPGHRKDDQQKRNNVDYRQLRENDGVRQDVDLTEVDITEIVRSVQQVHWLKEHGMCIDRIRAGPSTLPEAGRGAFANTPIAKGTVIAPAPLLVLKRDDLAMYELNQSGQDNYRDFLNFDRVVGHELLLNYCYGHKDSPLLLLPNSPIVNFINHNGQKPNAQIRWSNHPEFSSQHWQDLHPLDVLDHSGELLMEFVALRDIAPGEEIFIDYGSEWEAAWAKYSAEDIGAGDNSPPSFRQEIGVPIHFFPDKWKNQSTVYALAPVEAPLKPGELAQMKWAHNNEPFAHNFFRMGLPSGFSAQMRAFAEQKGIVRAYEKLLFFDILEDNQWFVFNNTHGEEWFGHRFQSSAWDFNIHYVAPWDEAAQTSLHRAFGTGGLDHVFEGLANFFELNNVTCIHASFMGVTNCDKSFTHADVFATGEKMFNIIWPVIVVNGSKPELNIFGDDPNIELSVNYEYDTAFVMGDYGYHRTSPIDYSESGQMRLVLGMYCGQVDESNVLVAKEIYSGEHPAPFFDQFELPLKEAHWGDGFSLPK